MVKKYYKKVVLLALVLFLTLLIVWLYLADFGKNKQLEFGVTFSQKYASELELDWQETFLQLLDDLGVKKFRLVAYWDEIEPEKGQYNFSDLEWQLNEVKKRDGQVVLAIGNRVPRWPECHWPSWIFNSTEEQRKEQILNLLEETVNHFKDYGVITAWQVENEPFLNVFGECPRLDKEFYHSELSLVRSLDGRPLVITESGELSTWLRGSKLADYLGVSLYRITWNKWLGYFYYPLPPAHYYIKSGLVKLLTGVQDVFVSEMQMEPWVSRQLLLTSMEEQYRSMNPEIFAKNITYVRRTGLSPIYLWGAEWWYWLKQQGDDTIWQLAGELWP